MWKLILLALFCGFLVSAKEFKVCRSNTGNNDDACSRIKRGESSVTCEPVLDATDCALKLIKNEVDFGVFTPDELLLTYQTFPNRIRVSHELRHRDRVEEIFEHQMVALVSITESTADLNSFKDGGLCHSGFFDTQSLNDRVLKKFERSISGSQCNEDLTYTENELINLKNFFGKSCRPGKWVADEVVDATLKQKYPELCSLCDNQASCLYSDMDNHGHSGALQCLKQNKGRIAYVALSHARDYLNKFPVKVPMFQMLCPNGTLKAFDMENPCAWDEQRWSVIVIREDSSEQLAPSLTNWLAPSSNDDWTKDLRDIVVGDDLVAKPLPKLIQHGAYLSENKTGSSLDLPEYKKCGKDIKWCTISLSEKNKCQWVANAASIFGIAPKISCELTSSTFECFRSISDSKTDIMTIDSNYGYVARKVFSLSTVIYADIDGEQSNVVLAVIKNSASSKFSSLQDLKGKKACFPEYGGISWMSFPNIVRATNLTSGSESCDFKQIASEIWSEACVPGIEDSDHKLLQKSSKADGNSKKLCSLCSEFNCQANDENIFFRDNGAFRCIERDVADIAFIKLKNLNDSTGIGNADQYRVLCKNGSLAINTGFNVDDNCAWAITIDSEVVSRNNNRDVEYANIVEVLLKLNKWFAYHRTPIHLYQQFNNTKDLLFKDSTVGLESSTSQYKPIKAYKELMVEAEKCSPSSSALSFISLSSLIMSLIFNRVL